MAVLFRPYSNIKDFLSRFTIFKFGVLHIRLHKITDKDQSSLYHNHPFHYISLILKGGYQESIINESTNEKKVLVHGVFSVIVRSNKVFHRIEGLNGEVITLFIAYGNYGWRAINTAADVPDDGLFERVINGKTVWSKRERGIWYIGNPQKEIAMSEYRHSIHQVEMIK